MHKTDNGAIFKVKIQPSAQNDEIVGVQGDDLKIKINARPVKGKANKALVDFLARKLAVKNSQLEIILPYALIPTPAYKDDCPDIGHPYKILIITA